MTRRSKYKFAPHDAVRFVHNGGSGVGKILFKDLRRAKTWHVYAPGHGRFVVAEDALEPHE